MEGQEMLVKLNTVLGIRKRMWIVFLIISKYLFLWDIFFD